MKLILLALCGSLSVEAFVTIPKNERSSSAMNAVKEATFGMGCFWKPSEELLKVDGVIDTVAGYTGNPSATEVPKYDKVCYGRQWVEGVRVVYDDDKVSYPQLLDAFFEAQEPKPGSRQYASIVFPHDQDQQEAAETWLRAGADKVRGDGVPLKITQVEALSPFYKAEGYHQTYWQKFRPRAAAVVGLIALEIFNFDGYVTPDIASSIDTFADYALKAIGVFVLLERVLDTKVEEL